MKTAFSAKEIESGISKEQYKKVNSLGKVLNKKFSKCNSIFFGRYNMYNIAEIIIEKEFKNESEIFKDMLLANTLFPKNKDFAQILLANGLNLETLEYLNKENSNKNKYLLNELDKLSQDYFGTNILKNVIQNKINQLLVFRPEFLIPEKELIKINKATIELTNSLKNKNSINFLYYSIIRSTGKVTFEYNIILDGETKDITNSLNEIAEDLEKYLKAGNELKNIEVKISGISKNKFIEALNDNPEEISNKILNSKILYSKDSDLVETICNVINYNRQNKEKNEYINATIYKLPETKKLTKTSKR